MFYRFRAFAFRIAGLMLLVSVAGAEDVGGIGFQPLAASVKPGSLPVTAPFAVPAGYEQIILSDETNLDIYQAHDWPDMNTLNESGPQARRYLYRTHEVRSGNNQLRDGTRGGSLSVIDLETGDSRRLATRSDWEALDGIVWTPWGTLLFAEETNAVEFPDPEVIEAQSGLVYEMRLKPDNPDEMAQVSVRPLLGALAHEGIEIDESGNVYVIDEDYTGSLYKFVPEAYGDLSQGQLYALRLNEDKGDRTGPAEWVALDKEMVSENAQDAAAKVDATTWCRPEDLERIGATLYMALTCKKNNMMGQRKENRILSISLEPNPVVRNFVKAGVNAPLESAGNPKGFASPDNLADGPGGVLYIAEDNMPSDIWLAEPDRDGDGLSDGVHLFASLSDKAGEATGIYYDEPASRLFVNVQHSVSGNDKTLVIRRMVH